jgi:hypothetical protein
MRGNEKEENGCFSWWQSEVSGRNPPHTHWHVMTSVGWNQQVSLLCVWDGRGGAPPHYMTVTGEADCPCYTRVLNEPLWQLSHRACSSTRFSRHTSMDVTRTAFRKAKAVVAASVCSKMFILGSFNDAVSSSGCRLWCRMIHPTGCPSGTAPDLYSWGALFESRATHRQFWLRFVVFFSPSRKVSRY